MHSAPFFEQRGERRGRHAHLEKLAAELFTKQRVLYNWLLLLLKTKYTKARTRCRCDESNSGKVAADADHWIGSFGATRVGDVWGK